MNEPTPTPEVKTQIQKELSAKNHAIREVELKLKLLQHQAIEPSEYNAYHEELRGIQNQLQAQSGGYGQSYGSNPWIKAYL